MFNSIIITRHHILFFHLLTTPLTTHLAIQPYTAPHLIHSSAFVHDITLLKQFQWATPLLFSIALQPTLVHFQLASFAIIILIQS